MNEQPEPVPVSRIPRQQGGQPFGGSTTTVALIIYILYLLCYFAYFPMIVGVVIAYTCRAGSGELVAGHYRFQIRTFWISLVYMAIVTVIALTVILFPLAILLGTLASIWVVVRCVRGIVSLQRGEMPHNPDTWLY